MSIQRWRLALAFPGLQSKAPAVVWDSLMKDCLEAKLFITNLTEIEVADDACIKIGNGSNDPPPGETG